MTGLEKMAVCQNNRGKGKKGGGSPLSHAISRRSGAEDVLHPPPFAVLHKEHESEPPQLKISN